MIRDAKGFYDCLHKHNTNTLFSGNQNCGIGIHGFKIWPRLQQRWYFVVCTQNLENHGGISKMHLCNKKLENSNAETDMISYIVFCTDVDFLYLTFIFMHVCMSEWLRVSKVIILLRIVNHAWLDGHFLSSNSELTFLTLTYERLYFYNPPLYKSNWTIFQAHKMHICNFNQK